MPSGWRGWIIDWKLTTQKRVKIEVDVWYNYVSTTADQLSLCMLSDWHGWILHNHYLLRSKMVKVEVNVWYPYVSTTADLPLQYHLHLSSCLLPADSWISRICAMSSEPPSSLANSCRPDNLTSTLQSVNRWRHNEYSCCSHSLLFVQASHTPVVKVRLVVWWSDLRGKGVTVYAVWLPRMDPSPKTTYKKGKGRG